MTDETGHPTAAAAGPTIPFREDFKDAILSGRKTMTTRNRVYGRPGDHFNAFGAEFEIIVIVHLPLGMVADRFWEEEGAKSPEDFIRIWDEIHPRRKFDSGQRVVIHEFRRVAPSSDGKDAKRVEE